MASPGGDLTETLRTIERAAGTLATASVARMDDTLPWFRELSADKRSWVMLVAQAGVRSLVEWLRRDGQGGGAATAEVADEVFEAAPRALARAITLPQTVALVQVTIDVVEEYVPRLAAPGQEPALREAVLRFSREVAFSAARVYARAAETRASWDARLQAMLVDALLRGDSPDVLASRAAALGWADVPPVAVVVGSAPPGEATHALHGLHRLARRTGADVVGGVHGDRLVVLVGGADRPGAAAQLLPAFGPGPVVVGPAVRTLDEATSSARAALAGFRAAAAWPDAPRPVAADDLLAERALSGDSEARRRLRHDVYGALVRGGGELRETLEAYFAAGAVLESAARALYVHPNTVRYRLKRAAEVTGYSALHARDGFVLRLALAVGRLDPPTPDAR